MAQFAVGPQVTPVWNGQGPVLLANQDLVNAVTIGYQPNVVMDAQNADVIPPLGSIAYLGGTTLYAIAPAGTAALLAIANGTSWAPSPAEVALQISTLGLAKDTSVQSVVGNTGSALSMGVPPNVPNIKGAAQIGVNPGSSPATVYTFTGNGRAWGYLLAGVVQSTSGASNGRVFFRGLVGGQPVATLEKASITAVNSDSGEIFVPLNGYSVPNTTAVTIDVNGGSSVSGAVIAGSAVFLYSIP